MRFVSVIAHAFGPFSGQALDLAPGLNVVYGLNEAGKSSWHAALYAGLCGIRRGKGKQPQHDLDFRDRYRPWDQGERGRWEVGAIVELEDGRRIELRHDLEGRVKCSAADTVLGRDYAQDIQNDGTPDGSKWLGLDRRAFLATACVRQADVLGVVANADQLREHLQRAAATASADATVAEALGQIERFKSEHVGQTWANSTRPLRQAIDRLESARQALALARRDHDEYLDLAQQVTTAKERKDLAERALQLVEARSAALVADSAELQLHRAQILAARYPAPPVAPGDDDALSHDVATALAAWERRPPVIHLTGLTSAELRSQIAALPEMSVGDRVVDVSVADAAQQVRDARSALDRHDRERPPNPTMPDTGGASEQDLRDLARDLSTPLPSIDPSLLQRHQRAQQRVDELTAKAKNPVGLVLAVALFLAGIGALLGGLAVPGVALLIVAAVAWLTLARGDDAARLLAIEELRAAETALGEQRHAYDQASQRIQAARQRIVELGLTEDPAGLYWLATALHNAIEASRFFDLWSQKCQALAADARIADDKLALALRARGVEIGADLGEALTTYTLGCAERARIAVEAAKREGLERELAARIQAEEAAQRAVEERDQAKQRLDDVAGRCRVEGATDEAVVTELRAWQARRAVELGRQREAAQEWAELQALLNGKTLAELTARVAQHRQTAVDRAEGLDRAALETVVLEADIAGQIDRLAKDLATVVGELDRLDGQRAERLRHLHSVAEAEEAVAAAEVELARVRQLEQTLDLTAQFLKAAEERVHRDIAPILASSVRQWLPAVTAGRYRDVRVDPANLQLQVCDSNGNWREAALLSRGTTEQIYLLLRVAMARHLTRPNEICPLVLDDVTVQSDGPRTVAILETLHHFSTERQVILFTQESDVCDWARLHLVEPRDMLTELAVPVATA